MPIYEYQCEVCPTVFSVLTSYARREDTQVCSNCGERKNHPIMSATRTNFTFADRSADKRLRPPRKEAVSNDGDDAGWS